MAARLFFCTGHCGVICKQNLQDRLTVLRKPLDPRRGMGAIAGHCQDQISQPVRRYIGQQHSNNHSAMALPAQDAKTFFRPSVV